MEASIPSSTVFDRQDAAWREAVLSCALPRFGVQYGCRAALGIDRFGESAPTPDVFRHWGLAALKLADLVQAGCDEEQPLVRSSN